jgi:beta-galactosidase
VEFARIPRSQWGARLRAARDAGLNCIETPVVWALHEPRPGVFKWDGEQDLVAFIKEIGALGMHAVLRVGPFVGGGWDMGGLPLWLLEPTGRRLRGTDPAYLGACARWLSTLASHVSDLQASGTSRKRTGPVLLARLEHHWFCHHEPVGGAMFTELARYLREGGLTVPILNTNTLFQSVEGAIDGWSDGRELFAHMRQLCSVRPDQPRFAAGIHATGGIGGVWAGAREVDPSSAATVLQRAMLEVLATGAQFNIEPFHAAPNWGFTGAKSTRALTRAPSQLPAASSFSGSHRTFLFWLFLSSPPASVSFR